MIGFTGWCGGQKPLGRIFLGLTGALLVPGVFQTVVAQDDPPALPDTPPPGGYAITPSGVYAPPAGGYVPAADIQGVFPACLYFPAACLRACANNGVGLFSRRFCQRFCQRFCGTGRAAISVILAIPAVISVILAISAAISVILAILAVPGCSDSL